MTVELEVKQKVDEQVNLDQCQEMIMSIFSCVGYLRDLFPEDSFQEHKVAGMNLKKFVRGKDRRSDQLLDWIEKGCFDALKKRYLKQAILTVLSDTTGPNNVLETYTLRVTYPSSLLHQGLDAGLSKLSLTRNDQKILSLSTTSFTDSMSKILRNLCVMSQTLNALPQRKYLSMKLVYYEEVTPTGYEPPGFQAAEFELEQLFVAPSVRYSFGHATNSTHGIALKMETTLSDTNPKLEDANTVQVNGDNLAESMVIQDKDKLKTNEISKEATKVIAQSTIKKTDKNTFKPFVKPVDVALASQVAQPANSPPAFPLSQPFDSNTTITTTATTANPTTMTTHETIRKVKCSCGVHKQALEMVHCLQCDNWQHTVCVGFISRKDRRLEARNPESSPPYVCYYCKYGKQPNTFAFLKHLSLFRKAVMTLSAEGYDTLARFGNLMEVGKNMAAGIRNELVKEGFLLERDRSRGRYSVRSPPDEFMKGRIKYFFHQNLTIFPEFVEAQRKDGIDCAVGDEETGTDHPTTTHMSIDQPTTTLLPIYQATTPMSVKQPTTPMSIAPATAIKPQPKMTKKRAASASQSASNEDFMSQTPTINRVNGTGSNSSATNKKLKMSIPNENISYN